MSPPNLQLWENYETFGRARGQMVSHILSRRINMRDTNVLDFGCGGGGIALELAAVGAKVIAYDENKEKISQLKFKVQRSFSNLNIAGRMPNKINYFDAIIVLDVIEHLLHPEKVLEQLNDALKPGGILYLSTPNRLSPINVLCDPHFSLPFVALFSRKCVRFVIADVLRWQPRERVDFPQLVQLSDLWRLLTDTGFQPEFINSEAAKYAFQNPHAIWNRKWHLKVVEWSKKSGLTKVVAKHLSDCPDFFNNWINPSWYLIAKKKPDANVHQAF